VCVIVSRKAAIEKFQFHGNFLKHLRDQVLGVRVTRFVGKRLFNCKLLDNQFRLDFRIPLVGFSEFLKIFTRFFRLFRFVIYSAME